MSWTALNHIKSSIIKMRTRTEHDATGTHIIDIKVISNYYYNYMVSFQNCKHWSPHGNSNHKAVASPTCNVLKWKRSSYLTKIYKRSRQNNTIFQIGNVQILQKKKKITLIVALINIHMFRFLRFLQTATLSYEFHHFKLQTYQVFLQKRAKLICLSLRLRGSFLGLVQKTQNMQAWLNHISGACFPC